MMMKRFSKVKVFCFILFMMLLLATPQKINFDSKPAEKIKRIKEQALINKLKIPSISTSDQVYLNAVYFIRLKKNERIKKN